MGQFDLSHRPKVPISLLMSFLVILLSFSLPLFADLDPTSPLLRGRGSSPTIETLDSGRFIIKPPEERKSSTGRSPRSQEVTPPQTISKPDVAPTESEAEAKAETKVEVKEPEAPKAEEQIVANEKVEQTPREDLSEGDFDLIQRLRVLVLGVNDKELERLKYHSNKKTEAENSIEIYLAPSYFYYDSSSLFSVKNFSSSTPGHTVGLSLWFSPYFGLEGEMQSSLGGSISSLTDESINSLKISKNKVGLSFRSIRVTDPLAPQTVWKISYMDFSTATSGSTGGRVSTRSTGLQIAFEAELPSSHSYAHRIGVSIEPKLTLKESSGSQNIRSGRSSSNSAISASVGGEIKFNRKNQIYWTLQHRYERNFFKGASNYPDPETGVTADGLNVDQSLTFFSIGYRWGR